MPAHGLAFDFGGAQHFRRLLTDHPYGGSSLRSGVRFIDYANVNRRPRAPLVCKSRGSRNRKQVRAMTFEEVVGA